MPAGYKALSTLTKPQRGLLNQTISGLAGQSSNIAQNPLFQQAQGYLQQLLSGSPESTKAFEAPAMRQFNEKTIPQLTNFFGGQGAGSSSSFQQALGQHGAALSENLQSLRSGLQMQALPEALNFAQQPVSNLLDFSNLGLNTQAQGYAPRQQGFLKSLLTGLAPGVGAAFGGGGLGSLLSLLGGRGGASQRQGMSGGNLSNTLQGTGGGVVANQGQSFLDPFSPEYSPFVGRQSYQDASRSLSPESQGTLALLQKLLSGAGLF